MDTYQLSQISAIKRHYLLHWGLVVLAFVACYYPTFLWLNYKFQQAESYYSHGYLIPFVSLFLVYQKRHVLKTIAHSYNSLGLLLIVLALLSHLFGVLGDVNFVSAFSMVLYLAGCSLYLLGSGYTRAIAFPLFFLIFMCPLPSNFIDIVALPFKSLATSLALFLINLVGIPYSREGFMVHLTTSTFVVGTPCNGMRSLISFLSLGCLLVYLIRTDWWKRILFLAVILPISILLNGLRIAMLLYIANRYGQKAASPESYLHDVSGMFVFVIGLIVLMLLYRWIYAEDRPS